MANNRDPHIAVISSRRWANVDAMLKRVPDSATWYVPEGQVDGYLANGAVNVVGVEGLVGARNAALKHAFAQDRPCVQTDDDLKGIGFTADGALVTTISFAEAVDKMLEGALETGAYLAGAAPTPNSYFYGKPIGKVHFVCASICLVLPCGLRFDPALELKEDYDYTLQHLQTFGCVARVNGILPNYQHYSNKGGAVAVRSVELEQATISYLMEKWPGKLSLNHKRKNEILLKWKPQGA